MKKQLITLITTIMIVGIIDSVAQQQNYESINVELAKEKDSEYIRSFKAIYADGKYYLNWKVAGQKNDVVYIVEGSNDGKSYEFVDYIDAVGVPIPDEILHSVVVENSDKKFNKFKLSYFTIKREPKSAVIEFAKGPNDTNK
jgi:hypothetical protein